MYDDIAQRAMLGGKIDPLTEIRNAGIVTNGTVFWAKSTADTDYKTFVNVIRNRKLISGSVQGAINATRNDRNDIVFVVPQDANAVYGVGTSVDVNKDRVHIYGAGYNRAKRSYSVTLRSSMGTVPDTQVLDVSGDGVEIAGLRVLGTLGTNAGGTMSNGVAFIQGHDFWAHDMVFEDSTDAWGTPPVVRGGGTAAHDAQFDRVDFVISGTGNVESAGNSALVNSGNGNKRWEINYSEFGLPAGSVTETFFSGGTGATVKTTLRYCHFEATNGTAFAITSAVRGSVTANNPILLYYCSGLGVTALGTDPNVRSVPNQAGTAGAGVHNPLLYFIGSSPVVAG